MAVNPTFKKWKKGDPLKADDLNRLAEAAELAAKTTVDQPLEMINHPGGVHIRLAGVKEIWAKITSGSNPYAWSEVTPAAAGTFVVSPWNNTGTTSVNPAYEQTGNTAVAANTIVKLKRAYSTGEWLFLYASC